MRRGTFAVLFGVMVLILAVGVAGAAEKYKGFERGDALITAKELKQLMDAKDPQLVVVAVAKPASFLLGHIPGSLNVWRPDYEPKKGTVYPYGGMRLDRAAFESFVRGLGINNDSKVVLYDEKYDATRLWWMFYIYGKKDVRILDGGYPAWKAAGYDVERGGAREVKQPGQFTATAANRNMIAFLDDVWNAKTSGDLQLWDTREKAEWTGEKLKKGAFTKGRIPWATFQNWKEFKMKVAEGEKNPTAFKPAAEIQKVIEKFGMDKNKKQIFYCQSGVRTTTGMFALYLMGWDPDQLMNYDGSWIEWSYYHKNLPDSGAIVCEACK